MRKKYATVIHKTDLALLYMPHLQPATARYHLRTWINFNEELVEELEKTGYRKNNHYFSPQQVRLIFKYLGTP